MPAPQFHFTFFVKGIPSTRRFYGEILGCADGCGKETGIALELTSFKHLEHVFPA